VQLYLDSLEQLSGWSVDTTTGLVTFGTPPVLGVEVTADFEFDVPVRFDTDHMAGDRRDLPAARPAADAEGRSETLAVARSSGSPWAGEDHSSP
jgi:uncharacterized protein (TIGR02217 family)